MARSAALLAALALACHLSAALAAVTPYQRPINQDCSKSGAGSVNYFPQEYFLAGDTVVSKPDSVQVSVAQDFSVEYYNSYKVVTNRKVNATYLLLQCGALQSASVALPAANKTFAIPLTALSVTETVPFAFLVALNASDRVAQVSSFVTAPCGQALLACGANRSAPSSLSNATLLEARVEPVADAILGSGAAPAVGKAIAFSAATDPGVLNRVEWVKYLAVFLNKEAEANAFFNATVAAYQATNQSVADMLAKGGAGARRPVVAWLSHFVYGADEAYEVSFAPFKAQYTRDAGGQMPNQTALAATRGVTVAPFSSATLRFAWNSNSSFPSQAAALAALHSFLSQVDVVMDETYADDPTAYNLTNFLAEFELAPSDNYTFLTQKRVFRQDGLLSENLGLDWFEGAFVKPQAVLTDIVRATHPQLLPAGYKATWIRNIAAGEAPVVQGPAACTQLRGCTAAPAAICPYVRQCTDGSLAKRVTGTACDYQPNCTAASP